MMPIICSIADLGVSWTALNLIIICIPRQVSSLLWVWSYHHDSCPVDSHLVVVAHTDCFQIGVPVWAIPSLELEFCPLTPPQPCPQYRINFLVNRGEGPYTPAGGQDTKCQAVMPIDHVVTAWQKCEDERLQWRWEDFDAVTTSMSQWPKDIEGFAHIGLRQLNNETL